MAVVGTAYVRVRILSTGMEKEIADAVKKAFAAAGKDIDKDADASGRRASRKMREGFDLKEFSRIGGDLSKSLHEGFSLGIGRARMGKSVLSGLLLAAPSLISGAGAIGGAMASELITFFSAVGPGLGGAVGVGIAAVSTLALNAGLLFAAFKAGNKELDAAKDSLKELAKQLGEPIAAGMASGFTSFAASLKSILPQINDLLEETGAAFGRMFDSLGRTLSSAENLSRIRGILANNIPFIDNFSKGINGLTTSFLILFNAAKPFIDYIGESIAIFGEWAASSLQISEGNGNLGAWMDRMLAKFKQLMGIIVDFGIGIKNVFSAASKTGEGLLTRIEDIGRRFREWTGDSGNQERMSQFFAKMDVLAHAVFETFGKLFGAAGKGLENMNLQPILDFLTILQTSVGPAIASIFREIKEGAGPNLLEAFNNLGTGLQKVADSGAVQAIAEGLSRIVLAASEFINTDIGSAIFSVLLPLGLFGGILSSVIGPLSAIVSVLGALASAGLIPVAAAIGALVGGFILMYTNSQNLRDAISDLGGVISEHFFGVIDKIKPLIDPLIESVLKLGEALGDKLAGAINFLAPILGYLIDKLGVIFEAIIKQVTSFFNFISSVLTGDWEAAWGYVVEIVQNTWDMLVGLFGDIVSAAWEFVQSVGEKLGAGWESVEEKVSEVWTGVLMWLGETWNSIVTGIGDWITNMTDGISEGFSSIGTTISDAWSGVTTFFSDLWSSIIEGVVSFGAGVISYISWAFNGVLDFIKGFGQGLLTVFNVVWQFSLIPLKIVWNLIMLIWNAIKDSLFEIWERIVAGAKEVWGGITEFFSTVWKGVEEVAKTVWEAITGFLAGVWDGIVSVATDIWEGLVAFFSGLWFRIHQAFETVWGVIAEVATAIWDRIVLVAETIWEVLVDFFSELWRRIHEHLEAAWNLIVEFLSGMWEGISSTATTIWNGIAQFFAGIWEGISQTFHAVVDAVAGWLDEQWQRISTAASEAWNEISSTASELWNGIISGIEDIVEPIVGTLQGWWDDISSAVSSAWDGLAGIIGPIWENIKTAIVQPIEDAWNALTGWATQIGEVISGIVGSVNEAVTDVNSKLAEMLADQATAGTLANQAAQAGQGPLAPALAEGGIVPPIPGGWNVIIGEGGRSERVEPLDKQGLSRRDRALISHMVQQMAGQQGGTTPVSVQVNLDGSALRGLVSSVVVQGQEELSKRVNRGRRRPA